MRVLNSVTDPRMGGPQKRALNVANELENRGVETVFLIPEGNDDFVEAALDDGFEICRMSPYQIRPPKDIFGNSRFLASFLPMVWDIQQIIRDEDIDIVHAGMSINYQTSLAAKRTDTPLIWHFNDTLMPSPVKQVSAITARRWADKIVVVADAVHEYYFSGDTESETVYTPVNLEEFDPHSLDIDETSLRDELGIPQEIPVVGTVGNINPIKGHEYLLYAVSQLIEEEDTQVTVPIVGKQLDSRKDYYERLLSLRSELGLDEHVKFVGFRSDIPRLLNLFDVFVLPSIAEACPTVVLEAMAMNTPVVATDVGGVKEELPDRNYGWVVPPKNPEALCRAISEAISNPEECARRTRNSRDRVESIFSLENCANRHEELYRSLV